ncbi:hypothetical protein F511_46142 [Dorcoceras hygrometricum]|uniref:Uncharacterized protein n=1 Tax=Dorcoceras hygrometricum TaxID=472368 RepID=A0A2Z7A199_9LAMI|nr:hypothetical protein F511_46142 [Dorcoceras hygrometricum]
MARITYPEAHPDLENYRMESQRHTNQRNNIHEILGMLTETHSRELQINQLIILPQQPNRKLKSKLGCEAHASNRNAKITNANQNDNTLHTSANLIKALRYNRSIQSKYDVA